MEKGYRAYWCGLSVIVEYDSNPEAMEIARKINEYNDYVESITIYLPARITTIIALEK